ncbi:MAG: response regulator [Candidatus Rokubacteria bacterium]|nr:response regulator [Candidatus Rokubacteria bacterium]
MRVLVVDDSLPRRRLLTALLGRAGHEVLTAPNGAAALELLEGQSAEAVVSDVKMPRMDGFQLCRALRRDGRWARLPFIFYSSVFIGDRAQELGMDLGATAYLDAKHVPPDQVAKEIDALVNRVVSAEYRETLVRLRDDLEFARRYHQVVLSSLDRHAGVRDTISSNVNALDEILTRLDAERRALAERTDVTVPVAELNRLKELSDYLGDKINDPLGVILGGADRPATAAPGGATTEAAASVRAAVRRINELVRKMTGRDRPGTEGTRHG